jgi:hypothetical protein
VDCGEAARRRGLTAEGGRIAPRILAWEALHRELRRAISNEVLFTYCAPARNVRRLTMRLFWFHS